MHINVFILSDHHTTPHSEVAERLQEINDLKALLAESQTSIQRKEQEIIKIHKMVRIIMFLIFITVY